MKQFSYTIKDELGIHARPAGELVKLAGGFTSDIKIAKGEQTGDLKRIFSVMTLGTRQGDTIEITAEGPDEEAAATQIEEFLKANL
jgi:phosphocarrier protein